MVENHTRLRIELPLLLPQVQDEQDQCVARLEERLLSARGVERAHITRSDGQAFFCIHYAPQQITLRQVQQLADQSGAAVASRFRHESLRILGMDCADCAASLEHILARLSGVLAVSVSYAAERMQIEYDASLVNRAQILQRIDGMGYQVHEQPARGWLGEHAELARSLLAGLLLALGLASQVLLWPSGLSIGLFAGSMLAGGYDAARHGLAAVRHLRFDVDLLMVLAASGSAGLGRWAEGAFLLFLFSLGHALERHAMQRARGAIQSLGEISPQTARVRREGAERQLPVEQLLRGDRVIVRPGERLAADGVVVDGRSAVDQSPLTGESLPVEVAAGDAVLAGSLNGEGALEIEVTQLSKDSTLARVLVLVREAQTQKSPTQQLTERFTRRFVPLVLAGTGAVILLPPLLGWLPWQESLLRGLTVLVASSPCALAIATPSVVLSAVAQAARHGVLVKGGAHLESLGTVGAIAFDKTGTLTIGRPQITDVVPSGGASSDELLQVAVAVERRASHPLASAVLEEAERRGLPRIAADEVTAIAGQGLRAEFEGGEVQVGGRRLFAEADVPLPAEMAEQAVRLEAEGKSVILVRRRGEFLGILAAADQPRPGVEGVLRKLKALGLRASVMLTGDNPHVAGALARRLGIDDFRAELLPQDKLEAVRHLDRQYGGVAMVGDGVNDAPALAHSTVGIAMGAGGSHLALETADVALMADDLGMLPFAVSLGRRARRTIRQNLILSAGVIAGLIPAAVLGLAGIGPAILLHEGSTLLVVSNALRLLSHRPQA